MSFIIGIFAVIGVLTTAVASAMTVVAAVDSRALRRKPTEPTPEPSTTATNADGWPFGRAGGAS